MSTSPDWHNILDCTEKGPRANLTNVVRVLQHDPTLGPDLLWYDEFLDQVLTATHAWRDEDDYRLTVYLQETAGLVTIADTLVAKAVRYVAHQRPRHVVRDWLTALVWDGIGRIAEAFEDHWGVTCDESLPCEYVRAASQNFFLGLVARILRPGCQLDTMVVFEGEQGIRKSSALRTLAGPWYSAAADSVHTKDFFESLRGKWIIEIGELDAFNRAEVTRVKTVISTPTDYYRPSYGRTAIEYPRQCVFAGTTNRDDWGNDDTGLRRFWPVKCGEIRLDSLADARAQLFAEAVAAITAGATWWEMPALPTLAVQADRQSDHAWDDLIRDGVALLEETTTLDILTRILKMDAADITRPAELAVGSSLRRAGWRKRNRRREGKQGKVWIAPGSWR